MSGRRQVDHDYPADHDRDHDARIPPRDDIADADNDGDVDASVFSRILTNIHIAKVTVIAWIHWLAELTMENKDTLTAVAVVAGAIATVFPPAATVAVVITALLGVSLCIVHGDSLAPYGPATLTLAQQLVAAVQSGSAAAAVGAGLQWANSAADVSVNQAAPTVKNHLAALAVLFVAFLGFCVYRVLCMHPFCWLLAGAFIVVCLLRKAVFVLVLAAYIVRTMAPFVWLGHVTCFSSFSLWSVFSDAGVSPAPATCHPGKADVFIFVVVFLLCLLNDNGLLSWNPFTWLISKMVVGSRLQAAALKSLCRSCLVFCLVCVGIFPVTHVAAHNVIFFIFLLELMYVVEMTELRIVWAGYKRKPSDYNKDVITDCCLGFAYGLYKAVDYTWCPTKRWCIAAVCIRALLVLATTVAGLIYCSCCGVPCLFMIAACAVACILDELQILALIVLHKNVKAFAKDTDRLKFCIGFREDDGMSASS